MLEHLNDYFNNTKTDNGALAYKSTKSYVLDLFSTGGAFRNRSDEEVSILFSKAFSENPLLAMKTLFYIRDIREGQGERRFFRVAMKHLALHNKESLKKNLHLVSEFGRWDDLWVLLNTDLKSDVAELVQRQLLKDKKSDNPSLLAKWMPSEGASSKQTKDYARTLREYYCVTPRQYRKLLSSIRKKINLVETNLTNKNYNDIEYSKIPSRAGLFYRNAFIRNDNERYSEFLDKLSKGTETINANTLLPHDIVRESLRSYDGNNVWNGWQSKELSSKEIQLLDAQWKSLPDFIGENKENSIAVVDTSGSMSGTPMEVAISLGLYLSERNEGTFHNHFFTFSGRPELISVTGSNIVEKIRNISDSNWCQNTDIELVFKKILDTAVKNNVPQEDMIDKVYIISDMQFDTCVYGADVNTFTKLEEEFISKGYKIPSLVFWNVNAFKSNTPFTLNEEGVQLVSGFSPSIFKQLMSGNVTTPYDLMLEVVNSERYSEVTA